jgi:hypothetical protein
MHELYICIFSFCMNLMYVARCRLCFVLDCVFFYKLNVDCIFYPAVMGVLMSAYDVATVDSSSDGLGATIATDVFGLSLLSYHCSDA